MYGKSAVLWQFLMIRNLRVSYHLVLHQIASQPLFFFDEWLGLCLNSGLCRISIIPDMLHLDVEHINLGRDLGDQLVHHLHCVVFVRISWFRLFWNMAHTDNWSRTAAGRLGSLIDTLSTARSLNFRVQSLQVSCCRLSILGIWLHIRRFFEADRSTLLSTCGNRLQLKASVIEVRTSAHHHLLHRTWTACFARSTTSLRLDTHIQQFERVERLGAIQGPLSSIFSILDTL